MVHVVVPRMSTVVVDGVGGDMEKVRGRQKKGHVLVDQIAEITGKVRFLVVASILRFAELGRGGSSRLDESECICV